MIFENQMNPYCRFLDSLKTLNLQGPKVENIKPSKLINAVEMPWLNAQPCQQFDLLYQNRLQRYSNRFPTLPNPTLLSNIDSESIKTYVVGIVKRIQSNRIRVFDKQYNQIMQDNDGGKDMILYTPEDEFEIQDQTGKIKFLLTQKSTMDGKITNLLQLPFGIILGLCGKFNKKINKFLVNQLVLPTPLPQNLLKELPKDNNWWKTIILVQPEPKQLRKLIRILECIPNKQIYSIQSAIIILNTKQNSLYIKQIDSLLNQLSFIVDIYVMPYYDSMKTYPHEPYNKLLFKKSCYKINLVSNPQLFEIKNSNLQILMCSGENIKDFKRNCQLRKKQLMDIEGQEKSTTLEIMEKLLRYQHMSPTCPYSLQSRPYRQDTMVINRMPHIFICRHQKQIYEQKQIKFDNGATTKLIALGKSKFCIIDLNNRNCQQIQFINKWKN